MLIKNEERIFVSDEIKDIVYIDDNKSQEKINLSLKCKNNRYTIKKIKQSIDKTKITFFCNKSFLDYFYSDKSNLNLTVELDNKEILRFNIDKQFSSLIIINYNECLAKITVLNDKENKDGI